MTLKRLQLAIQMQLLTERRTKMDALHSAVDRVNDEQLSAVLHKWMMEKASVSHRTSELNSLALELQFRRLERELQENTAELGNQRLYLHKTEFGMLE